MAPAPMHKHVSIRGGGLAFTYTCSSHQTSSDVFLRHDHVQVG